MFQYTNNFVNMNMNTAEMMGGNGALGRRRKRQLRGLTQDILKIIKNEKHESLIGYYAKAIGQR